MCVIFDQTIWNEVHERLGNRLIGVGWKTPTLRRILSNGVVVSTEQFVEVGPEMWNVYNDYDIFPGLVVNPGAWHHPCHVWCLRDPALAARYSLPVIFRADEIVSCGISYDDLRFGDRRFSEIAVARYAVVPNWWPPQIPTRWPAFDDLLAEAQNYADMLPVPEEPIVTECDVCCSRTGMVFGLNVDFGD